MTTLTFAGIYQPFTRFVNTGSSPESKRLEERFKEIVLHFRRRAERERAFYELVRVVKQGKEPNWDQYGASKLEDHISQMACRFLNALPSVIPTPEVGLDPDGEISFSWIQSRDRQVHVSLSSQGLLSYAGLFGPTSSVHGQEPFDDSVPMPIIEAVRRLGIQV
jgi:hypothetical protein